jgi:hypothetical protein
VSGLLTVSCRVTKVCYEEEREHPVIDLFAYNHGFMLTVPWDRRQSGVVPNVGDLLTLTFAAHVG